MSKEMKDFLSQFMNQPEPKAVEVIKKKIIEKKEAKPKAEKTTAVKKDKKTTQVAAKTSINTEGVGERLMAEDFLQTVNNKKFAYDKKKNLQIDDNLYGILNLLKQHEDIKSIATLLNAIIEKYIADNKDELKRILSKNPLL